MSEMHEEVNFGPDSPPWDDRNHGQLMATVTEEEYGESVEEREMLARVNQISDLLAGIDLCRLRAAEKTAEVMNGLPPEVRSELTSFVAEMDMQVESLLQEIEIMEAEVRAWCVATGKALKGNGLTFSFIPPKPKWNDDQLMGYATAHPEIMAFCTMSKPSTRVVKSTIKPGK